jgi:pimeloyl-ACP methyl ester carboxylesterase
MTGATTPWAWRATPSRLWRPGDRTERLRSLRVPTPVLHGTDDIMIDVSGGRATAAAVPGAKLVTIDGMGQPAPTTLA